MSPSTSALAADPDGSSGRARDGALHAPLRVVGQDADLLAINKPCGLLVHPTALDRHADTSVVTLWRQQTGETLWPLHRLDKATSGVLVMARHAEAASLWRQAFEQRTARKRYLALVRGWTPDAGEIDHPLARDPEQASAGQVHLAALTRFRTRARFEWPFQTHPRHPLSRYSLVEVWPQTGRRHQIRRHFKHIAHPLVGDTTHGKGEHNRAVAAWLGQSRLWLHALDIELQTEAAPASTRRFGAEPGPEWRHLLRAGSDARDQPDQAMLNLLLRGDGEEVFG